MFKTRDWYKKLNLIWLSLGVYILILGIFLLNINNIWAYSYRNESKVVREGILLPQVDGVETIFYVDPLLSASKNTATREIRKKVSSLIFSSLFRENTAGGLDNDLVESYSFNDAKDLNIRIKDKVYWSDNEQLTAYDIEFTFNVLRSLGQESLYSGAINNGDFEVKVLSQNDLQISLKSETLPRPNASYLYELVFPILPKHVLINYTKPQYNLLPLTDFGKKPVTSGMFLYDINRIDELTLKTNFSYFGQIPKIDAYTFRFYKDYTELIDAFKLRNVDLFIRDQNLRDEEHRLLLQENVNFGEYITRNRKIALYFNLATKSEKPSIFNKLVIPRRNLLHAISRSEISTQLGGIALREIYGPIDHASWAFSPEVLERNAYRPQDLESTLKLQGYSKVDGIYTKEGQQLDIKLTYLGTKFNDEFVTALSKQLRQEGIVLVSDRSDPSQENSLQINQNSFTSKVNNREYDLLLTYVDKNLDPDVYLEWHSSRVNPPGINFSGFDSNVADRTLLDGKVLAKQDDRKNQYFRFQKAFYDELTPAIFLFNPSVSVYSSQKLKLNINKELNTDSTIYSTITDWEKVD